MPIAQPFTAVRPPVWSEWIRRAAVGSVLALLLLYTDVLLVQVPYMGLLVYPDGTIRNIYIEAEGLEIGDQIIQAGAVRWADFERDLFQAMFEQAQPGDVLPLYIHRAGERLLVNWVVPGFNWPEFWIGRVSSQWILGYVFWALGALAALLLYPRDLRQRLLVAFSFLTALWLTTSAVSRTHAWGSALVLRSAIWLSWPVYWHLHWAFPQPLRRAPTWPWWLLYGLCAVLAVAEWFRLVPLNAYLVGLLLALGGSLGLLLARLILQPRQRRDVFILFLGAALAVLPSIGIGVAALAFPAFMTTPLFSTLVGGVLSLPILPLMYAYVAVRRRLGGLEVRLNRLISFYIFLLLMSFVIILPAAAADVTFPFAGATPTIILVASVVSIGLTLGFYPSVRQFVEQRVLGAPVPPPHLVETYAERITHALDRASLVRLLTDGLLPSLLIRQSSLVWLDDPQHPAIIYVTGVEERALPAPSDVTLLLEQAGHVRERHHLPGPIDLSLVCPWVRVALPLRLEGQTVGLWLLGRRDPDDYYSPAEIDTLRAIAHQVAIALAHIAQTEHLRALYQADIDRAERERMTLARRLHDDLLSQLALLKVSVEEHGASPEFLRSYDALLRDLRQIISGLRPPMLNFGLHPALNALADEVAERGGAHPVIVFEVTPTGVRYDPYIEQHLYRIVQQAIENALRHAHASTIRIRGQLAPEGCDLTVEDDGVGFAAGERLDLTQWLGQRHFGLVGMAERAALIRAQLQLESTPGRGTWVRVRWQSDEPGGGAQFAA